MRILSRLFGRRGLTCDQVSAVLQEYLDNELDPAQVPTVLEHLEACRDCGLEAELYAKIKASLVSHRHHPDADSLDRLRSLAGQLAESGIPEGLDPGH